MSDETTQPSGGLRRSDFLKRSGVAVGGVARGVSRRRRRGPARSLDAASTINIGYVSPLTGPDSGFGEPDPYVVGLARAAFAKGLKVGGKSYGVKIIEKDSQSGPDRRASAQQLIASDGRSAARDIDARDRRSGGRRG